MSNGTRKKVVDFKKLLVNEEESMLIRKKGSKPNYSYQNNSHKKDKNSKNVSKQKENQSKGLEKQPTKKQKTRNLQKKEQISIYEFTNKLKEYQEELAFLSKKRNADINIEKIISYQKSNQNKSNSALNNDNKNKNNNSKNKKSENIKDINNNNTNSKNLNLQNTSPNQNLNQINTKTEVDNENSTLIIDFYKLYYHLFESNRLDNSKPYKFVDYLITGDNLLFNLKKDKSRFEEIKKGMTLKPKNNLLISEQLLNKSIYEYLRCDFSNSFMKKLAEKVNIFLMNRYLNKKRGKNSLETSISLEKKDKFTYSNFLADKLKDNVNKSCLSFTNDTEYFKSLIYVCNKYSKYIGKKEIPEKILIESLEKNKKILESFKNTGEETCDVAKKIEDDYLKDLLHNKSIKKYTSKKLKSFNGELVENNKILKNIDLNNFYKILNIIIKNKNDDDIDKLYKLLEEENIFIDPDKNNKIDKNDLRSFIILFRFLLELVLTNKLNDINTINNLNENNVNNNITLTREIYEFINLIQFNNRQKINESENNSSTTNSVQKKGRSKLKLKKEKEIVEENELSNISNIDKKNNDQENKININNDNENSQNNNIMSKKENNNNMNNVNINNNANVKPKRRQIKNSKIIPFKIPYPINNNNNSSNTNISSNKTNNGLFEINNINNEKNNNNNNNLNQLKTEELSKNNLSDKAPFETHSENNDNNKEKDNNNNSKSDVKVRNKRRRKNVEDNKDTNNKNKNNDSNKISEKNKEKEYNLLNNSITFGTLNSNTIKEINISKYILNKLSSGQNIFKLIIEKPKIKRSKEKIETEKEGNDKVQTVEDFNPKDKEKNIENENEKENIEKQNNEKIEKEVEKKEKRRRRVRKEKKEEVKIKKEKEDEKEGKEEIKIKKEEIYIKEEPKEEKEETKQEKEVKKLNLLDMKIIKDSNNKDVNKEVNNKKEIETREDSAKSLEKNEKIINNYINISKINSINTNNIFHSCKNDKEKEKERNIDIINFNNGMIHEGETIKEITRNDLKHSPNIGVKISQKSLKFPIQKNNDLIFNINSSSTKFLFSTNKNSNLETKSKIRKTKNENNKKDSFRNINIQIDRQSLEIKGGNVILNDKRDNEKDDNYKIKEYFNNIE